MQRHLRSLLFFLSLAQSLLANISYPSEGPIGGFHYQVTSISESGGNYVGTAVLTSYTYTSGTPDAPGPEPFPDTFQVPVTVNPGAENQEFRSAKCTVSGLGDFQLNSNAYWTGIVTIVGDCNLNGHHLKIDKTADYDPADPVSPGQPGNLLSYGGNFDLNGGQVEAAGNWDQRGSVNIGAGGSLAVSGSYIHQSGQLSLNGGSLEIAGDYLQQSDGNGDGTYESNCNGQLYMSNPDDYMLVGGMAQFWAFGYYNSSTPPSLIAGMLEIKGDFMQKFASSTNYSYSDGSFRASGAHRVKLSGTGTQTVTFENPGGSYFNILEVTNPHPLVFNSVVQAARVTGNAAIAIQSSGEGGISGTFESDVTFTGNAFTILSVTNLGGRTLTVNCPVKQLGELNLSGGIITITGAGGWDQRSGGLTIGTNGRMSVSGSYIHQSGQLSLNGGSLEIAGDYLQQSDGNGDGTYESNCNGQLYMSNPDDYMLVGGMAQFWAFGYYNSSTPPSLTAGMLEIKGDFMQKFASSTNYSYSDGSFRASGAHRVKLSGTATQTVTFENPGGSYFNILEVTNPKGVSNSSTLSVTSGGSLALNYSGTDVVGTLYLGGVQQANGLYDATHTGGLITGSGKIQVGPFASFSAWAAANAPGQTTDQDHDHDGVPNGIEYFMGKTGNDFTADPGISPDGTVTWPKSPAFNGSYAVQTSEDLVEWTDVTEDAAQVTKNSDSVVWTRPTGPDKCFVRLLVTPN